MKKTYIILLIMSMMLVFSCTLKYDTSDELGAFDISPNDQHIVFSYLEDGASSIYEVNIDGTNLKKIIRSENGYNFYNPKYSPDGKKLVFVKKKKGSINRSLCISNADGSNIQYLTDDKHIVTEASFSLNGELLYFCMANVYPKYASPLETNDHDFEICSYNLINNTVRKLSNLNAYQINNISDMDDTYMLVYIGGTPYGGMYLYPKDSATAPKPIIPMNDPWKNARYYYTPIYADNLKTIGFTAPYEIYIMNVEDMVAKLVFSNKGHDHLQYIAFFKNQNKILFSKVRSTDLFSINTDGTELRTIPITIK